MIKKIATKSQKELLLFSKKNKLKYLNSKPYPHLVFKNFFDKDFLNKVSKEFPDLSKIKTSINYDNIILLILCQRFIQNHELTIKICLFMLLATVI